MTLKLAQFCDDPQKIFTKSSYPKKIFIFLKTQKSIEIQNFEPQKIVRAYVYGKISEYPHGSKTFTKTASFWNSTLQAQKFKHGFFHSCGSELILGPQPLCGMSVHTFTKTASYWNLTLQVQKFKHRFFQLKFEGTPSLQVHSLNKT